VTVRATLERSGGPEQQAFARKTLRLIVASPRANSEATEVLIHDLSATGLLIESSAALKIGQKIAVDLRRAGLREARVAWSTARFYGCTFVERLPPAAISVALRRALSDRSAAQVNDNVAMETLRRLAALREERELTVKQLAKRLRVSRQTLWYWETGQRVPRRQMLMRIVRELGLDDAQLGASSKPGEPALGAVKKCKEELAAHYGVSIEKVKIIVER
jgi:transcriptional regulator with XRE-family HTH domain